MKRAGIVVLLCVVVGLVIGVACAARVRIVQRGALDCVQWVGRRQVTTGWRGVVNNITSSFGFVFEERCVMQAPIRFSAGRITGGAMLTRGDGYAVSGPRFDGRATELGPPDSSWDD